MATGEPSAANGEVAEAHREAHARVKRDAAAHGIFHHGRSTAEPRPAARSDPMDQQPIKPPTLEWRRPGQLFPHGAAVPRSTLHVLAPGLDMHHMAWPTGQGQGGHPGPNCRW